MTLVGPLMINLKTTVRDDCAFSACGRRPLLFIQFLAPLLVEEGGFGFWTDVHYPPCPQLLASEIKQIFLSTNLACLLVFE